MASKNFKIEQVFNNALKSWGTTNNIPVAWEGKSYKPVVGTNYVSEVLLPSRPQNVAIGKDVTQRHTGIYQIDVYANAKKDADNIITLLEAAFKVGYPLTYSGTSVQVTNFYADPHGIEDGWYRVSISIFYRCEL